MMQHRQHGRVAQNCISPNKEGAGILIRRLTTSQPTNEAVASSGSIQDHRQYRENGQASIRSSLSSSMLQDDVYPTVGDVCVIHYSCYISDSTTGALTLVDATMDMKKQHNNEGRHNSNHGGQIRSPLEFEIGKGDVIQGLEIAVQRMIPSPCFASGRIVYQVTIPHLYAYGFRGHPPEIPSCSDVVLYVELVRVRYKNKRQQRSWWDLMFFFQ
jgi:hypothetical protein